MEEGVVEVDEAVVGLHEDFLEAVAVVEKIGGGAVGRDDGAPMADMPRLLVADAHLFGAGVVAVGTHDGDGEYLKAVARGDNGTVAVGLLGEGLFQFNSDAVVVGQACHVVDRRKVGCGE